MTTFNWSALPPVLTLKELIAQGFIRLSVKSAWNQLEHGRFPIRHIDVRPYRFNRDDVRVYVMHGEKTNPLLLNPALAKRRLFARVARAKVAKAS